MKLVCLLRGLRLLVWLWLGLLWLVHLGRKDDKDKSYFREVAL